MRKNIVEKALLNAGWSKDRKIPKETFLEILKEEGYPQLDCVVDFLASYGNMVIYFNNLQNGLKDDDINFNIEHAINVENSERVLDDYMPRVGKKLCIIGSAYRDHICLLMAEDGSVYGGYSDFLCKIGNTGEYAIEAIILNYSVEEI